MNSIEIKISNKVAVCKKAFPISSNTGYKLVFSFDEEWKNEKEKTARLVFDESYIDIKMSENTALLPKIPPCESLSVGVYSKNLASTLAEIGCVLSCADVKCKKYDI